jgi:hypothetical protein
MARSWEVRKTGPEACDLINRQRRHHTFGSAHAQLDQGRAPTPEAQGRTSPIPMLKSRPRLRHSSGGFEPQYTFGDADPAIDTGGSGARLLAGLELNVIQQR